MFKLLHEMCNFNVHIIKLWCFSFPKKNVNLAFKKLWSRACMGNMLFKNICHVYEPHYKP